MSKITIADKLALSIRPYEKVRSDTKAGISPVYQSTIWTDRWLFIKADTQSTAKHFALGGCELVETAVNNLLDSYGYIQCSS